MAIQFQPDDVYGLYDVFNFSEVSESDNDVFAYVMGLIIFDISNDWEDIVKRTIGVFGSDCMPKIMKVTCLLDFTKHTSSYGEECVLVKIKNTKYVKDEPFMVAVD